MAVSFCFQGWVRGVDVEVVTEVSTGKKLYVKNVPDVKDVPDETIVEKLRSREWAISLKDHLNVSDKEEIEIHDFDLST